MAESPPAHRHRMDLPRRSLVIVHEDSGSTRDGGYFLSLMRPFWEMWGCRIMDVEGSDRWPKADGVFIHADLSQVPADYAEKAQNYPFQWNVRARDIRKRSYCEHLVSPGDGYEGPVIVKTNLNHAGIPERIQILKQNRKLQDSWLARLWPGSGRRKMQSVPPPCSKEHYKIYERSSDVPAEIHQNPDWIVQKFCSEQLGNEFMLREYYFLGDVEYLRTEAASDANFTTGRLVSECHDPAPESLKLLRHKLGLDYGKIDYVMHEGQPFVFDANKTIGMTPNPSETAKDIARCVAWGLFPEWRVYKSVRS